MGWGKGRGKFSEVEIVGWVVKDDYDNTSCIQSFQDAGEEIIQFSGWLYIAFMLVEVSELICKLTSCELTWGELIRSDDWDLCHCHPPFSLRNSLCQS